VKIQGTDETISFPNVTVEMETGTGKTYVYLRTALELNRRYGLKKFIIVVPSVAVREGVLKTLQVTHAHFAELFDNERQAEDPAVPRGVAAQQLPGGRVPVPDGVPLFFHYPHYAWHKANRLSGAVRSGQYKLIRRYDDNSLELFDLANDIGEKRNLAAEKPELAAKLDGQLTDWLKATAAQMPMPIK
jgi:hypothetical protein